MKYKVHKTTFQSDMIFTKDATSTSDEQVEKLTREINIHSRACMGSLIYLISTRVDFSLAVRKLAKFLENPGIIHFEGLVHILRYIRDNNTLVLKYYDNVNDEPVSDLLRQASIKIEDHLMDYYSSFQDCTDTDRIIETYIIFYQGGPIHHGTHVSGLVDQSSAEIEYSKSCTTGMALHISGC